MNKNYEYTLIYTYIQINIEKYIQSQLMESLTRIQYVLRHLCRQL